MHFNTFGHQNVRNVFDLFHIERWPFENVACSASESRYSADHKMSIGMCSFVERRVHQPFLLRDALLGQSNSCALM